MKRKVIELGNQCRVISLPKKWVDQHNVKKGDELDVEEQSTGELLITSETNKPKVIKTVEVDTTGMNSFQVNRLIRGLYRSKVDEIILHFSKPVIKDLKRKKENDIFTLTNTICQKLIGLEVIKKTDNSITLQCFISLEDVASIDATERRIFFLIKDFMNDITNNLDDFGKFYSLMYGQHDMVAKFCEYYLRTIVYSPIPVAIKTANYNLISLLDKLTDCLRHLCDEINQQKKTTLKVKQTLSSLFSLFADYERFLFSKAPTTIVEIRYHLQHKINSEKFTISEYKIITQVLLILDLINDIVEVKRIREATLQLP